MKSNSSDQASNKKRLDDYLRIVRERLVEKSGPCPDDKRLRAYFKKNLSDKEMEKIRDHISVCEHCIEKIKQIAAEGDSTAAETLIPSRIVQEDWKKFKKRISKNKNPWDQVAQLLRLAAAIALVLTSAVAGGFYLTRPAYYPLAKINAEVELRKLNTFRGSDPLAQGIFALKNKNFQRAKEIFMNYINQNPEIFPGHYYAGMTLLFKGQSGLVARFRFRQVYVEQAIGHLQTALSLLDDNPHQAANCYWFLGKAYLMKGEMALAKAEFQKILAISEAGVKRTQAAEQILEKIEP